MVSSTRFSTAVACSVMIAALGNACAVAPDGATDGGEATVQELSFAESGTVLFELESREGDFVTIYEFEDGSVAAVGRLNEHADPELRALVEQASRGGDLSELYLRLAADRADSGVAAKLAELDRLSATPASADLEALHPVELGTETAAEVPDFGLGSNVETRTSNAQCFQSDLFYNREADGWARHNCVTTDGIPNVFCRTNRDDQILYDWHRVRRFRATVFNQTRCNQAVFRCDNKWTTNWGFKSHFQRFFATDVGPRQQFFCFTNANGIDNLDTRAFVEDVSGPERGHLCMAANRVQ